LELSLVRNTSTDGLEGEDHETVRMVFSKHHKCDIWGWP
jgi:hypothetical protein